MSGVPYTFATATTSIPLSQLDANFATNATLGNTTVGLGNTVTSIGNLTLTNVTLSGGTIATLGNTAITGGSTTTSIQGLTSLGFAAAAGTNGITFNNNTSGVQTESLLNDYETGTWTTTFGSYSNCSGGSLASNATYIKIGKQVTLFGYITLTKTNTVLGQCYVPFTVPFAINTGETSSGIAADNNSQYTAFIASLSGTSSVTNTYICVPVSSAMPATTGLFMFSYTYQSTF